MRELRFSFLSFFLLVAWIVETAIPIMLSNIYCVVLLFCLSCVSYVASLSGLPIFDCPFGIL